MAEQCPICFSDVLIPVSEVFENSAKSYACPNCGRFELSFEAQHMGPSTEGRPAHERALLSHSIRKMSRQGSKPAFVTPDLVRSILGDHKLPTPTEQLENLLLWLGENLPFWGSRITLKPETHMAVMGAVDVENFMAVLKELTGTRLIEGTFVFGPSFTGTLTLAGWRAFEELRRSGSRSRKAFMAMPYGKPVLDKTFRECFKPAAERAGFTLNRLDESPQAGLIDSRLRVEIRTSRFLVADLTDDNQGAYWEAGFAEGLGRPVIYTCERNYFKEHKTHFDTNHHLTMLWEAASPSDAGAELTAIIRATLPDEAILE